MLNLLSLSMLRKISNCDSYTFDCYRYGLGKILIGLLIGRALRQTAVPVVIPVIELPLILKLVR